MLSLQIRILQGRDYTGFAADGQGMDFVSRIAYRVLRIAPGLGLFWPFDFAQGRAELEFLAGIGFVLALFFGVGWSGILG